MAAPAAVFLVKAGLAAAGDKRVRNAVLSVAAAILLPFVLILMVLLCALSGTAQHNELHADHVLFVGYAPAESPQISIAVRITYGYNSGYSAEIGRDIARVYFNQDAAQEVVTGSAADLGTGIAGD